MAAGCSHISGDSLALRVDEKVSLIKKGCGKVRSKSIDLIPTSKTEVGGQPPRVDLKLASVRS